MLIDFEPAKDKLNRAQHGLSLAFAKKLVWDEALVWLDSRYEYDELRMVGLVPEGNTLYYVAFVDRGEVRHVISHQSSVFGMQSVKRSNTMSKTIPKRVITLPSIKENAKIVAAAKADPDAQPLTASQLKAMVPLKSIRGRPKSENKKMLVSVRYSPEVVKYFRSTGEGWQSRMDGILRDYVNKQLPRRARKAT